MNLLYFSTATNAEHYESIQKQSKVKASVASQVFESALLAGLSQQHIDLTLHSFPMIAAFPGSRKLLWGAKKEQISGGFTTTWLPTVNLYGLKQWSQRLSARRAVKRWLKETAQEADRAILLYSIYEPIADAVLKYAGKAGCKTFAIVPDLPRDMYKTISKNPLKAAMQKRYMRRAEALQGCFDGYIYLTDSMREVIAPDKPYTVIEGIAEVGFLRYPFLKEKGKKRAVMYAGALRADYGLKNLVDGFLAADLPDAELWLFGAGDFAAELQKAAQEHENIRFPGRVSRDDILTCERAATLLVNVRDPQESFTKYSFPSKTIEYMLSGTPLLTTRLQGIPDEYFPYLYCMDDNSSETISKALLELLGKEPETLVEQGTAAQQFIAERKNASVQARRLTDFIGEVCHE